MSQELTYQLDLLIKKELSRQLFYSETRTRKMGKYKMHDACRKAFETKFLHTGLHNPLLYELEKNGVCLLGLGKLSMISPGKHGKRYGFCKIGNYNLYNKSHLVGLDYKVKYYYSEFVTLLFLSPARSDVIKERVRSNNVVSKSMEEGGLIRWLGL